MKRISRHELETLIAQARGLSNAIDEQLGIRQIWYDSNKVLRGLEDIKRMGLYVGELPKEG